jgi:uncharacterized protein (DUF697 family)
MSQVEEVNADTVDDPSPSIEAASAEPSATSDASRSMRLLLANDRVKNHVIAATGVSLVPVPLLDLVAIMGIQVDLMHSLCKVYEVPFQEKLVRSLLTSLASGAGAVVATTALRSLAKTIPVLGPLAGAAGLSASAAAITYATGQVFIDHLEAGGTLSNFNPSKATQAFKDKLKQGTEYVKSFTAGKPAAA